MDKHTCISNELWLGYSNKTLSQTETDMIQNHAERCEVCADIKEGIDALKRPASLNQRVNTINSQVDDFLKPKRNYTLFWNWSAAAVLVFGIGLSWLWVNNSNQITETQTDTINLANQVYKKPGLPSQTSPIIENLKKEVPLASNTNPPLKPEGRFDRRSNEDLLGNEAERNLAESMDDVENLYEFKKLPDSTLLVIKPDSATRGITWAFGDGNVNKSYAVPPANETIELDEKKLITIDFAIVENEALKKDKKMETSKRKSAANPAPMSNSTANTNYNTYNWAKTDSTTLALAQTDYDLKNYVKCLENLKLITSNPYSPYYEDGLLLKATTLIKQNKNKEAKAVLKKIISLNGVKKKEADDLLRGLN
ncbi:MAG: tetratricopeptide repeat protein [Bacteroidia bacterium]